MTERQPRDLIHGEQGPVMILTGRVAHYLNRRAGLDEFRVSSRGTDREVDVALVAMRAIGLAWLEAATGTKEAARPEPEPPSKWLTTTQVAHKLNIGDRAVRKAIAEGRLNATNDDGRYHISRVDFEHFKSNRRSNTDGR